MAWPETVLTSIWCLVARELDEPVRGRKANDGRATCWCAFGCCEQGNSPVRQSTGCRCVSRRWAVAGVQWSALLIMMATVHRVSQPYEVLEPCAGKLARTVPRGRGTGNRPLLPGVPVALRAPAAGYAERSASQDELHTEGIWCTV